MGETVWSSPHEPERGFRRSFSTSAATSAMKVCAQGCLWSAASFPSFGFLIIAQNNILFKAFSRWTFLTISCVFLSFSWLWRVVSRNRYDWEWVGWGEKEERRTGYADVGRRWRGEAEAKTSANGRLFKLYFIHKTSQGDVAKDIHVVRVVSILTSYLHNFQLLVCFQPNLPTCMMSA